MIVKQSIAGNVSTTLLYPTNIWLIVLKSAFQSSWNIINHKKYLEIQERHIYRFISVHIEYQFNLPICTMKKPSHVKNAREADDWSIRLKMLIIFSSYCVYQCLWVRCWKFEHRVIFVSLYDYMKNDFIRIRRYLIYDWYVNLLVVYK